MKALLLLSLLASTATFASTTTKTTEAKKATEAKALTLKQIAEKSQTTATILEQDKSNDKNAVLSVDNSGRLNTKEEALKLSADNAKATTATKK